MYNILSDTKITGRILVHATRFPAGSLLFADAVGGDANSTELKKSLLSQSGPTTIVPATGAGTGVLGTTGVPFAHVVTNVLTIKAANQGAVAPSHIAVFANSPLSILDPVKAMSWADFTGLISTSGPPGPAGPGLPAGGNAGQLIRKNAPATTNYVTEWFTPTYVEYSVAGTVSRLAMFSGSGATISNSRLPNPPQDALGQLYAYRANSGTVGAWEAFNPVGGGGTVTGTGATNRLAIWSGTTSITQLANSSGSSFLKSGSSDTVAPSFTGIVFADVGGRPTTYQGYGITNIFPIQGDQIPGQPAGTIWVHADRAEFQINVGWVKALTSGGGTEGPAGPPGPGVPTGGASNDLLRKKGSGDFSTEWFTPSYIEYVTNGTTNRLAMFTSGTGIGNSWIPNTPTAGGGLLYAFRASTSQSTVGSWEVFTGGDVSGGGVSGRLALWSSTAKQLTDVANATGVLKSSGSTPSFSALVAADIDSTALGSGTADGTTFLNGNRQWVTVTGGTGSMPEPPPDGFPYVRVVDPTTELGEWRRLVGDGEIVLT